jgi:hypothetical protein
VAAHISPEPEMTFSFARSSGCSRVELPPVLGSSERETGMNPGEPRFLPAGPTDRRPIQARYPLFISAFAHGLDPVWPALARVQDGDQMRLVLASRVSFSLI